MKKNKNEELQSRREFFKKAAKGALPILGAIILASNPVLAKAGETAMGCKYGCSTGCYTACSGSCKSGCDGTCKNACYGCKYTCEGTCKTPVLELVNIQVVDSYCVNEVVPVFLT
ncbi:Cys-Xaa-Xaa-Xaa repeat radical SAM target protein [Bacteroides fragilis]